MSGFFNNHIKYLYLRSEKGGQNVAEMLEAKCGIRFRFSEKNYPVGRFLGTGERDRVGVPIGLLFR
jgi:hypothetical protein